MKINYKGREADPNQVHTTPMLVPTTCRQKIVQMLEEVLNDTMKVFDFGAQKHPDSGDTPNFLMPNGNKCSKHDRGSSILRHAARTFMYPECKDSESNLPELLHLLSSTCIMYIRSKRNIQHPLDAVSEQHSQDE